jgi:trk system potassium uptake protein TrkA
MDVRLDACIQCTRCVRACREVQVNDVIGYAGRGSDARIVFDIEDPMGESSCVACGECVQACPTGALMRDAHWQVKLIESNRARCNEIAEQLDCLVLHGDGGDIDLLEQEGAAEMSVLVAVTDNDEKNLLISLLAKQLGTERIVTRADRLANERLFERVGVDVVRSAGGAAIRSVIRRVDHSESEIRAELEHGEACIIELELPASFNRIKLADLRPPEFARVATIVRGRSVIVPGGNDMLGAGDHLLIFCLRKDEDQTRAYFSEPPRLPEAKA